MSTYRPRRQGERDARDSKAPRTGQSAYNQAEYDEGFKLGTKLRQDKEKAAADREHEPTAQERVDALEARIAALELLVTELITSLQLWGRPLRASQARPGPTRP